MLTTTTSPDALAALALLGQAQRRLDGVLVEGVELPVRAGQIDLAAPELQLLLGFGTRLAVTRIFTSTRYIGTDDAPLTRRQRKAR